MSLFKKISVVVCIVSFMNSPLKALELDIDDAALYTAALVATTGTAYCGYKLIEWLKRPEMRIKRALSSAKQQILESETFLRSMGLTPGSTVRAQDVQEFLSIIVSNMQSRYGKAISYTIGSSYYTTATYVPSSPNNTIKNLLWELEHRSAFLKLATAKIDYCLVHYVTRSDFQELKAVRSKLVALKRALDNEIIPVLKDNLTSVVDYASYWIAHSFNHLYYTYLIQPTYPLF